MVLLLVDDVEVEELVVDVVLPKKRLDLHT